MRVWVSRSESESEQPGASEQLSDGAQRLSGGVRCSPRHSVLIHLCLLFVGERVSKGSVERGRRRRWIVGLASSPGCDVAPSGGVGGEEGEG